MGWDAMVFGELTFPEGGIDAWKKLPVAEGLYKGKTWTKSAWLGDPTEATTVAGMLSKLEDYRVWCDTRYPGPDQLCVVADGDRVSVRGYINEDDFRSWCGDLATMLRVAEKVGATGEYVAMANDDLAGERLVLAGGTSRCEPVDLMGTMTGGEVPESPLDYRAIIDELFTAVAAKMERETAKRVAREAAKTEGRAARKAAPAKKAATKKAAPAKKAATKKAAPAKRKATK